MGAKHVTYLDLSAEQRREAASQARARLRTHLSNPTLTPDQAAQIQAQMANIDRWEQGAIDMAPKKGQAHTVTLSEAVDVNEK